MKAYRLSLLFRTNAMYRQMRFSHSKVLIYTIFWTFITIIAIIVMVSVDPYKSTRQVVDVHRPSTDYHYCASGSISQAISIILIFGHLCISIYCVYLVRNGMEAFRDGTVLKESFILFYCSYLVTFMVDWLDTTASLSYVLRTSFLCLGTTLFCLRILISRCARHWMTSSMFELWNTYYNLYFRRWFTHVEVAYQRTSSVVQAEFYMATVNEQLMESDRESPLYKVELPTDSGMAELIAALSDYNRLSIFRSVAVAAHCEEMVDFVVSVIRFQREAEELAQHYSSESVTRLRNAAQGIVRTHVEANSEGEINVSSKTR